MSIDDQPLPSSDPGAPGALPDAQPGGGATTDASGSSDGANAPHAAGAAHETKDAQEEPAHGNGADPRSRLVALRAEVGKAIVGQDAAITGLVIALLAGGHVLLEGVPGVAKTLLVRSLAQCLDVSTSRVQFTPDLMPGDLTGSLIYDARSAAFSFREGPVFTNLLLADEINRTPPKTQAALLEAMEERQVSVDGAPRPLPDPFMVMGAVHPRRRGGGPLQVRAVLPGRLLASEGRPDGARHRGPAGHRLGGHRPLPRVGRRRVDGQARGHRPALGAHEHLRGAHRLVAAGPGLPRPGFIAQCWIAAVALRYGL